MFLFTLYDIRSVSLLIKNMLRLEQEHCVLQINTHLLQV